MFDSYEDTMYIKKYGRLHAVGEVLMRTREPLIALDRYAVSVNKAGTVIGHLPRKLSRVCSLFLRRGSTIDCTVIACISYF